MRQFDVFETPDGDLVCILTSPFLLDRAFLMVAYLERTDSPAVARLTPVVMVDGSRYLLDVSQQVAVRSSSLTRVEPMASLVEHRDAIMDAVNMHYWGF